MIRLAGASDWLILGGDLGRFLGERFSLALKSGCGKNEKCSRQRAQLGQNRGSQQVRLGSGGKVMGPEQAGLWVTWQMEAFEWL